MIDGKLNCTDCFFFVGLGKKGECQLGTPLIKCSTGMFGDIYFCPGEPYNGNDKPWAYVCPNFRPRND